MFRLFLKSDLIYRDQIRSACPDIQFKWFLAVYIYAKSSFMWFLVVQTFNNISE